MEKRIESEPQQNQKNKSFNAKLWIRVISVVLSISMVAVVCLGVALFSSNDEIAALQKDLKATNENLEELSAENKAAAAEIEALRSDLASTDKALAAVTAELAAVKETLTAELAAVKETFAAELAAVKGTLTTELAAVKKILAEELSLVKNTLKQSEEKRESLEKSLAALEEINQSTQDEIDQLKIDIENANEEIAALEAQLNEPQDKIRIYIDQGHNPAPYHNTGASGNGLYEQDVTFLIGCLLAEALTADGRFEVQLSRPNKSVVLGTDNKSSLMARVEGAAAFEADYLISLHTNSFGQNTAHGIEVYTAKESGESYIFGESLLKGLIDSTNLRNRGMKLGPDLDILEFSAMPAVLVEMGFISNPTDAALFSEHPDRFAEGLYNGILDYFGFLPKTPAAAE